MKTINAVIAVRLQHQNLIEIIETMKQLVIIVIVIVAGVWGCRSVYTVSISIVVHVHEKIIYIHYYVERIMKNYDLSRSLSCIPLLVS